MPEDPLPKKEETEKKIEKKEESPPFWKSMPPGIVIAIGIIIFFFIRSMEVGGKNKNFIYILIALGILYILSLQKAPRVTMVTPREAQLLVEREMDRLFLWGQFDTMDSYRLTGIYDLMHREGRGTYYNVGIEVTNPYKLPRYLIGKVAAKGEERAFTTIVESTRPIDGKDVHQETDMVKVPSWVKNIDKRPWMEKWFRG